MHYIILYFLHYISLYYSTGMLSFAQLNWLETTLRAAETSGESCIVFSHLPVYAECCRVDSLLWNCEAVLSVLHKYACAKAFISGHDHDGG